MCTYSTAAVEVYSNGRTGRMSSLTRVVMESKAHKRPCVLSKCHGVPTLRLYYIEMSALGSAHFVPQYPIACLETNISY